MADVSVSVCCASRIASSAVRPIHMGATAIGPPLVPSLNIRPGVAEGGLRPVVPRSIELGSFVNCESSEIYVEELLPRVSMTAGTAESAILACVCTISEAHRTR